jgi:hypothetical protein
MVELGLHLPREEDEVPGNNNYIKPLSPSRPLPEHDGDGELPPSNDNITPVEFSLPFFRKED